MRFHFGSLAFGGSLVAAGFALAHAPSWLAPAQAAVAPIAPQVLVTSEESHPERIYVWTLNGPALQSVALHQDQGDGVVVSRELKVVVAPRVR